MGMKLLIALCFSLFSHGHEVTSTSSNIAVPSSTQRAGLPTIKPNDVILAEKIRAEILKDPGISESAKSVRVLVANKGVTLKGFVESDAERAKLLEHAYITAPDYKIYNQISVKK
jgi:osmotically-inducible protein OsmY